MNFAGWRANLGLWLSLFGAVMGFAAPANDDFANRITITGWSTTMFGSNLGATPQAGEPNNYGDSGGQSVWWTWTAPFDGWVEIDTNGSDYDTTLGVYTGTDFPLATIADDDDAGVGVQSYVSFNATANTTYQILVDGYSSNQGSIVLSLNLPVPVPVVSSQPVSLVKNAGDSASFSVTAPDFPFRSYQWRRNGVDLADDGRISGAWTSHLTIANVGADDAGSYTVAIGNLGNSTLSDVATLTVNLPPAITIPPVSLVRNAGQGAGFSVAATGTPTLTYQWRKNGVNLADGGNVLGATTATLVLANVQAADAASYTVAITNGVGTTVSVPATLSLNANDLFAGAIVLSGSVVSGTGSNTTAAAEAGEPSHAGNTAARSVWWRWTAPATGLVTISTAGSGFDTVLGVYTGSAVGALTLVAANDDSGGGTSAVTFTATKDTVYQIAVDGYLGATGSVALAINLAPVPAITVIPSARQVVTLGQNLTLNATATGAAPLTYQWKRNGRPIAGATATSYTITGAIPARDNGWYQLLVTNAGGTTTSATVFVNVVVNPAELVFWGDSSYGVFSPPGGLTGLSLAGVAAGSSHGVALKGDGTVAAWGFPYYGVTSAPSNVTNAATANVVAIAAGNLHSLALKSDGTVVAWGYNVPGDNAVPTELGNVATARAVSVAAGASHSLALRADGTVVAWGSNTSGQSAVPDSLKNPLTAKVVAIAAGSNFSAALREDGTVMSWGSNSFNQITGSGSVTGAVAIAAGDEHLLALKADGTVVAWGRGTEGQTTVPGGLTGVGGIAARGNHSVAFRSATGAVVAWGSNSYGASTPQAGLDKIVGLAAGFQFTVALRNAAAGNFATLPVITQQPQNQTVAQGDYVYFQVVATAYPGVTYQWRKGGVNLPGQIYATCYFLTAPADAGSYDVVVTSPAGSVPSTSATLTVTAPVAPQITVQSPARNVVTAGGEFSLSVTATGGPTPQYQWKRNGRPVSGAIYPNYSVENASPVRDNGWYQVEVSNSAGTVTSQAFFVNVAVEYPQILGVGNNEHGQGTIPEDIGLLMAIDAGGDHNVGLRTDGTVVAWGAGKTSTGTWPEYGQSIVPAELMDPETANVVAVSGGYLHSVALRADGTVVAWGAGTANTETWPHFRQSAVPADLANAATAHVVAISAGGYQTLALRADGTIRVWGTSDANLATVPPDLADPATAHVVAIVAGGDHNLALQANGTLRAWGYNDFNQADPSYPYIYDSIVGLSSGWSYSTVVLAGGGVVTWGSDYYGETGDFPFPNNVALVSAGFGHQVALHNDGTVEAWGHNYNGQATMPEEVTGVFAVSAGDFHTVMLRDGAVPWANVTLDVPPGANLGDPATFDPVVQNLTGFGIKYQWFRNGSPVSEPSIEKTFVWSPVTMSDVGAEFTLQVTSFGSPPQNFGPWYITVNGRFTLDGPYDQTANAGDPVTFEAVLDGFPETPPTIHWEKDGATIPGANTTTLALTNVQVSDAGHYVIVATNPYQEEVRDAYLTINKTQATVTVGSLSVTYDGGPKSVATSTIPGGRAVNVTYNGSSAPPVDAGVYAVHAAINDASYYGEADGFLTITPGNATIEVPDQSVPYDGNPKSATVNTTPGGLPLSITYNGSSTLPSGPGHYEVVATVSSGNYAGSDNGSLDIVRATPVVTWGTLPDIVYGTPLSGLQRTAEANAPGTLTYGQPDGTILGVGTHQLTVSFKPYDILGYANATGQTSINVTAIPTTFALSQTSFTYTGSAQGPAIIPNPVGASFTAGGTTSATNAGNYTATATASGNYGGSNNALTWTIGKATATVTLGSLAATYDGTPKSASATTSPAGLTVNFTYNGSSTPPTNAGSYAVVATISNANYQGTASGTLVIGKAAATFALSATSFTYTGAPQGPMIVPSPAGATFTSGGTTSATAAGSYTATAAATGNYTGSNNALTWAIGKATATVTLGSLAPTYDGTPKAASATTSPVGLTVNFTYNGSATVPTNAGSYAVVGTISDSNYQGTASGTLVIGKANQAAVPSAITPVTLPYGSTFTNATFTAGAGTRLGTASWEYRLSAGSGWTALTSTPVNVPAVGGYLGVRVTYSGSSNYNPATSLEQVVVIGKATATVTLGSLTPTYDGTPKAATATTSPVGLTVNFTYNGSATAPTNAGSYAVVGTISDSNYQGTASGTLVIGKASQAAVPSAITPVALPYGSTFTNATFTAGAGTRLGTANWEYRLSAGSGWTALTSAPVNVPAVGGYLGVRVTFSGNGNYNAATSLEQVVAITKVNQATVPSAITPASLAFGGTIDATTFTAGAGTRTGTASWEYRLSNSGSWTALAAPVSVPAVGSYLGVRVTYSGDGNYNAATSAEQVVAIVAASQAAIPSAITPTSLAYGGTFSSTSFAAGAGSRIGTASWEYRLSNSGSWTALTVPVNVPAVGSYLGVRVTYSGNANLAAAISAEQVVTINPLATTFSLSATSFTYNGSAQGPAIVPNPAGATFTPGGTTSATAAGSYTATAMATGNYTGGNNSLNWTIGKATATVTLGGLTPTYDGTAKSASATTNPAGLTVNFTYNGSATAPTNAGSYTVVATLSNANYQGTANGTLVIAQANQATVPSAITPATLPYGGTFTAASFTAGAGTRLGTASWEYRLGNSSSWTALTAPVNVPAAGSYLGVRVTYSGNANYHAATSAEQVVAIAQSFGVMPSTFSWQGYLAANPDVAAAIGEVADRAQKAWDHYINYGIFEGRTDGDFNVQAYLAQYPALAAQFGTDLRAAALYWYTIGRSNGDRIPAGFSVAGYFLRNADIAAAFANDKYGAWLHYYNYGVFEGRSYDANFIVDEYLELNPDLKSSFGTNKQAALMHWLTWGHPIEDRMGRVPIGFNVDSYLARYPDLQTVFGGITPKAVRNVTVWHHYVAYGTLEGRTDGDFEAYNYLATNPDLAAVYGSDIRAAALHWFFYGRREGRRIPGGFDVQDYRARYPDIVVGLGDDLYGAWLHYRDTGVFEGRVFGELFRPADYLALNPDVVAVIGNNYRDALLHWLYYGQFEGRRARY